ncbi:BON domain-containing protein [Candidatus Microgenomates bacterium]|nr:MAG: BON domain-containing protein [Candidatus Microgenomates bacterium]
MFPYGYGYGGYGGYGAPYGGYGYGGYGPGYWGYGPDWDYTDYYDYNRNLVLDDNEIEDLVSDNIASDPYIPQRDVNSIEVKVEDGVVHLSGTVRNRRSKPLAYADAFWSRGVVDVQSNIKVEERSREREERGRKKEKEERQ